MHMKYSTHFFSVLVTIVFTTCFLVLYYFAFPRTLFARDVHAEVKELFLSPAMRPASYNVVYKDSPCKETDTTVMYDPALRSNFAPYGPINSVFSDTDYTCVPKGTTVSLNKNGKKGDFCVVSSGQRQVIGISDTWHPVLKLGPNETAPCGNAAWIKAMS